MNETEFAALADGRCPDCDGFIFRPGPRGGMAQNVECVGCSARFNIAKYASPEARARSGPMVLVMAGRLPREDEGGGTWREDMFPKVLQ